MAEITVTRKLIKYSSIYNNHHFALLKPQYTDFKIQLFYNWSQCVGFLNTDIVRFFFTSRNGYTINKKAAKTTQMSVIFELVFCSKQLGIHKLQATINNSSSSHNFNYRLTYITDHNYINISASDTCRKIFQNPYRYSYHK